MFNPMDECVLCGEAMGAVAQDTYKCTANCQSESTIAMTNSELADALNPRGAGIELSVRVEAARRLKTIDNILEAVAAARARLDDRANECVIGQIQSDADEWSRAICAIFSDYDNAVEKLAPPKDQQ